MTIMIVIWS